MAGMLPAATTRILTMLADDALVLDVGGWAAPFRRATHVLDLEPYATRGILGSYGDGPERFGADTWLMRDMCAREPWPFADDQFDFSLCVTTLEDIRDPIWVCSELSRVSRAGYVEVPTVEAELMHDVQGLGPWLGHLHHRWFCDAEGDGLVFWHKDHSVHFDWRLRVLGRWQEHMSDEDQLLGVFWEGELTAREEFLTHDTHAALIDRMAARVQARFRPSPAELRAKRVRERLRRSGARALRPLRRAAERAITRGGSA
jgi:hypothetical protein